MINIKNGRYKVGEFKLFEIESVAIEPQQSYAFIGKNGSGKSTLAKILVNEQPLLEGDAVHQFQRTALLSFESLQKMVEEEWKRNNTDNLSENEDDTGLFNHEVIQLEHKDKQRAAQLAEQFGISYLYNRRFKYLSTGETRKVLLCRAIMANPELLVLDEPFEGLDVESRAQLKQMLNQLYEAGVTIVLIVNRLNDIPEFINQVGVLSNCKLLKQADRDSVLNDPIVKDLFQKSPDQNVKIPESDHRDSILDPSVPRIILNDGVVYYGDEIILDHLTWRVNAKENWLIVGPNGAGKSTLLSLITGDHPQGYSNDLTLFGRKRGSGETIWDIKKHIGYVSSQLHASYRVNLSVKNVILSGYFDSIGVYEKSSDKQNQLADAWLALLNLSSAANQPFHSLSWGEQRLLLIIRALVKHPALLILDEPFQGLDEINREWMKAWIERLLAESDTQLLFVSHHLEDIPNCITHTLTFVPKESGGYEYLLKKRSE